MRRPLRILVSLVVAVCVVSMAVGCSSSEKAKGPEESEKTTPKAPLGPDGKPVKTIEDFPKDQDGHRVEAVIKTDRGEIVLRFFDDIAPVTVASFLNLARSGFYNGTRFHRVVREPEPFVIQGGDPKSKDPNATDVGTGGPGYYLPAEFSDRPHKTGTLSMARSSDPNSGGSQFFICLSDQPSLDGQYTVFGEVVSGMDVVNSIVQGDVINEIVIRPRSD